MEKEKTSRILEILEMEADSEKKQEIQQLEQKIFALKKEVEEQIEQNKKETLKKIQWHIHEERARRIGEAERQASELVLSAQHSLVQKIAHSLRTEIQILSEIQYKPILHRLIQEILPDTTPTTYLQVSPEDEKLTNEILSELKISIPVRTNVQQDRGIISVDPERGYTVYNTLQGRLEKALTILLENWNEVIS